jgi:hypothetical protein
MKVGGRRRAAVQGCQNDLTHSRRCWAQVRPTSANKRSSSWLKCRRARLRSPQSRRVATRAGHTRNGRALARRGDHSRPVLGVQVGHMRHLFLSMIHLFHTQNTDAAAECKIKRYMCSKFHAGCDTDALREPVRPQRTHRDCCRSIACRPRMSCAGRCAAVPAGTDSTTIEGARPCKDPA